MTSLVQRTITLPCDPRIMSEVRSMVRETLAHLNLAARTQHHLVLAVDEMVGSVVRYARYKGYRHDLSFTLDIDEVRFKAVLADPMNIFDPSEGGPALLERERSFTLSLALIRQIMDEVTYLYKRGFQNEIELIKFLSP